MINKVSFLFDLIRNISFLIFGIFVVIACSRSKTDNEEKPKLLHKQDENFVKVIVLTRGKFTKELVSNGKLRAVRKSDLKYAVNGQLEKLKVKNGNYVIGGQFLAVLNQFEFTQRLDQAQTSLNIANLELEDVLLGRGFKLQDTSKIPKDIYKMVQIRSGYITAKRDLKTAEYNLGATVLKAPFTGRIANLKYKLFEQVSSGEVFCTIIDESEFEVEFYLMESEIRDVSLKGDAYIIPFTSNTRIKGYISEINPIIDEQGLITVKARINNRTGSLIEGMNVRVFVENVVDSQFVVPKSAVLMRQNQEVLFKYANGKANWTYIKTLLENSVSFAVEVHQEKGGNLEPGDTIIISNNLNLAHESEVRIR